MPSSDSNPPSDPDETNELVVADGVALLRAAPEPRLAEALAAVPGVPLEGFAWALRVGPDRAASLEHIAVAFGLELGDGSRSALAALVARRSTDPVVEIVGDLADPRMSLLGEWSYLWAEELRAVPGTREVAEANRIEVPLSPWTAPAIAGIVRANSLRLSPACELALRDALEGPGGLRPAPTPGDKRPAHDVSIPSAGADVLLAAETGGGLAAEIAGLPGVRSLGRGAGRWTLPASPQAARAVRELSERHGDMTFDETSQAWLREAPRWIAHVEVEASGRAPRLVIATAWGEPPPTLTDSLTGAVRHARRIMAPLDAANLAALTESTRREAELSFSSGAQNSIDWLSLNPDATALPPAELDVIQEVDGPRYVIEAVWDEAVETEFQAQEATLARKAGRRDSELPAAGWPPDMLARFVRTRRVSLTLAAKALIEGVVVTDDDAQRLLAMSGADDADIEIDGLGGELMPFQRAGVVYALERRRVFLADEQGLGKTIQALATVQADLAYPAVVVCPASLKLNWLREIKAWLPGRTAIAISGRGDQELAGADLVVLNYEVAGSHLEALGNLSPRALILDESHYVKNPAAVRTQAVLALVERLGPDALRLALTGTPVVNRPAELAPQLRALDRLGEYGTMSSFRRGYATAGSRRKLHSRLRSSCYLRRRKADVLAQLPAKRRAVVTVPTSNAAEYRRAERNFVRWLTEQVDGSGSGRIAPEARAEALVKMTALRRLAARGKLEAALSWIEDFAESGERLVVFAHHREIQAAVIERFPDCARLVGDDSMEEREANVRRFQGEAGPELCVCSLQVASHGFTLTAAANVAFLELDWTPAKHDQAEDRVHRIGQAESVTAWYLLATETIDERIAELLAQKRDVVDSVTDGGGGTGASIADALIGAYASGEGVRTCWP
ncbi:MAG: DEAD/DEAH box helicase [Actinomycetota bacterium]|nr:DEAD/DEAH box helicase [Actinomycetota bacterium]